jgi:6-pyruvoyltetrahydropterin/6-carboxytetrahydropterin synthase
MIYTVSKEFTFEAAHRLLENYTGKCTNNHGHSWLIKLFVESSQLDNKGMVIDFQEMKKLKNWIDNELDHTTILWEKDPMCNYISDSGQRLYRTNGNPTSEKIGEIIFNKASEMFNNNSVKVVCVEVAETCTSSAQIKLDN